MEGSSVPFLFLVLLPFLSFRPSAAAADGDGLAFAGRLQSDEMGFISALITKNGLDFARDLLVEQAVDALIPLHLRDIEKTLSVPFVGKVYVKLSSVTLDHIEISSSTIQPGPSGVAIVASDATANITMEWYYSYTTWFFPLEISDSGNASVQIEGMEIGLTTRMENQGGTLKLTAVEVGCSMDDLSIALEGGASWLYQGLLDAFEEQIRASVETTIKKKITQGISKFDSLMQSLPKEVKVDDIVSLNVTFVNQPILGNSSIEVNVNGLFIGNNQPAVSRLLKRNSEEPGGQMHWTVDKVSDQSLLNTAGWRFIIPQLYKKYPNDDMKLNIVLTAPPTLKISRERFDASILADMTVDVLEADGRDDDFTLTLKWSNIGNFHMYLIQVHSSFIKLFILSSLELETIKFGGDAVFLNNVVVPYVNSRLRVGFPLPIIHGFTLPKCKYNLFGF
ncbi:unnamed protein product [Spirodela intermedia]|uniref:Lipid-binding serum glycoprotein N-terminal domain-containing protein n=1 Tax=Spirodela intermedia TaxID=51605 RepID=A0A7I8JLZ5_SPIIN|nr:unnamed protein product [Spirodela intermedia]CAA6670821.1 unnamed protein product [Spirodela intermedia]